MTLVTTEPLQPNDSLLDDASRILPELRRSFARVLNACPGHPRRPCDIARELGIHQTLAWKLRQVIDCKDAYAGARYIPGSSGVEIFLKAARAAGASTESIDRARSAIREYRRLIQAHAGNRAALELMLGASARDGHQRTELTYRKAGFQCSSYVWGVQARTRVNVSIAQPAGDHDMWFASVCGYVSLRRVRPQTRWTLWRKGGTITSADGAELECPIRPIDQSSVTPNGTTLLVPFCSTPLPRIETVPVADGDIEEQWVEGSVGAKSAITCFVGDTLREPTTRYRDEHNRYFSAGISVSTPVETLVHDMLIHHDLYGVLEPELAVISELEGKPWWYVIESNELDRRRLPTGDEVEHLGRGLSVVHTPHVPRYEDLMRYVFDKLGWDGSKFDVYRVCVHYPVVGTALVTLFDMPEDPRQPRAVASGPET